MRSISTLEITRIKDAVPLTDERTIYKVCRTLISLRNREGLETMPGNTITLNNVTEWYVGDSEMKVVLAVLDAVGRRTKDQGATKRVRGKEDQDV